MRSLDENLIKNSGDIFMSKSEKVYHIYAKDKCIFHSLKEEEFEITWKTLQNLVNILDTRYSTEDLTYEELQLNREVVSNSSH